MLTLPFSSLFVCFGSLGLHYCAWGFLSGCDQGLLLRALLQGFMCWPTCHGARALGAWASAVAACGVRGCGALALVAPQHVIFSWRRQGIKPVSPTVRAESHHCATRGPVLPLSEVTGYTRTPGIPSRPNIQAGIKNLITVTLS